MMIGTGIIRGFCRVALVLSLAAMPLFAQNVKRKTEVKTSSPVKTLPVPETTSDTSEPAPAVPAKKNGRPVDNSNAKSPTVDSSQTSTTSYTYEFSRPEFYIPYILIKHDENGKGTIAFKKKGVEEAQTDPITLSPVTMGKINDALTALNFLDSTESYQYEKDYSHLGNVTFTYNKEGKERTTKYNWTQNKDAKALSDEYRKISNQYTWEFDMTLARENQPLEAPKLMDVLDGYITRGEISDPKQMVPLLKALSNDERIPLIARNHASKLVGIIEKDKK
jgi:hypothetical protein